MPGAVAATTVPGASRHRAERARTSAAQPCRVAPRRSDSAGVCRVCYRPHRVCPSLMAPCVAEQESSSSAASRPTDAALRLQVRAAPLRRQPRRATLHISPRRAETTQEGWALLGTPRHTSARSPRHVVPFSRSRVPQCALRRAARAARQADKRGQARIPRTRAHTTHMRTPHSSVRLQQRAQKRSPKRTKSAAVPWFMSRTHSARVAPSLTPAPEQEPAPARR